MPYVWTYTGDYPMEVEIDEGEETVFTPEPGYDKIYSRTTPHTGEDGTGSETEWAGRFVIKLGLARKLWTEIRWLMSRKNNDEPFFFYLPWVTAPADATGATTAGRIVVKVFGKIRGTLTHQNKFVYQVTLKQVFNDWPS